MGLEFDEDWFSKKMMDRYDSLAVQEQLKAMKSNVLDDFVRNLDITWKVHKFRGEDKEYECCSATDLRNAYSEYMKGYRNKLRMDKLEEELARSYGITRCEKLVKINGTSPIAAFRRVKKAKEDEVEETEEEEIARIKTEIEDLERLLKAKQAKLNALKASHI